MMSRLRPALPFVALLALMLLAACRDEVVPLGVNEPAKINCSEECANRGQCGRLPDDRPAILASEGGPAVSGHNRFFFNESLVTITNTQERELIPASNGVPINMQAERMPHTFYQVTDGVKTAWVSGWCLARP